MPSYSIGKKYHGTPNNQTDQDYNTYIPETREKLIIFACEGIYVAFPGLDWHKEHHQSGYNHTSIY